MASEIRVNQIQNRSGLSTVTFSDTGVVISGITTISDLRTSGTTVVAAGTTSAPSISPTGDSNTGIFFPSPDTVAIAEGGVEALRVDSSGRVGVGTDIPSNKFELVGSDGTLVNIKRTGGTSVYQLMGNTDNNLGYIGYETKEFVFYPNNTKTVGITTNTGIKLYNGAGIDFSASSNAAGMTSELLSDYEEGTWTPTVQGVPNGNYTTRQGSYTRIGRIFIADFYVIINNSTAATDVNSLYGLPFTTSAVTSSATISYWFQIPTNVVSIVGYSFSSSQIDFYGATAASATSPAISVWGSASSSHGVQGTLVGRVD